MDLYRTPINKRPLRYGDGNLLLFPARRAVKSGVDEDFLIACIIANLQILGRWYSTLVPDYFRKMKRTSGVMINPFVPTSEIIPGAFFPGDIDLLVIPYEDDDLVLSMSMAVEVKIVRVQHSRQGKSPNRYGFSQAEASMRLGFPLVAVAHLVVSDNSPPEEYRTMLLGKIDHSDGEILLKDLTPVLADPMPQELLRRSYGRLCANCTNSNIGFFTTYLRGEQIWEPLGKEAVHCGFRKEALDGIKRYYDKNYDIFFQAPRY